MPWLLVKVSFEPSVTVVVSVAGVSLDPRLESVSAVSIAPPLESDTLSLVVSPLEANNTMPRLSVGLGAVITVMTTELPTVTEEEPVTVV
jgi:hypothetical protein